MAEFRAINPKENALVVRHNNLLNARYETTLQQIRIMLWLISEVRAEDRDFQSYRVSIKELAEFVGIKKNKNIYRELVQATKGMVGRLVEIGDPEDRSQDATYLQVGLVSSAKYKVGDGYIDLAISPELKPYLLNLQANFTTALLRDLMLLKRAYSIRMYDFMNQYRKIGKRVIKISDLRKTLCLEKKHKLYGHLKSRVIDPAINEINDSTDLQISYKERKMGKSVVELHFIIKVKKRFKGQEVSTDELSIADNQLIERMVDHGLNQKDAERYIRVYGETDRARITENLLKLEQKIKTGEKIDRPGGYLKASIDNDYRDQKSLFQTTTDEAEVETKQRKKEEREKEIRCATLEDELSKGEIAYRKYRATWLGETIDNLEVGERAVWESEFENNLEGYVLTRWQQNRVWSSSMMLTEAEKFIISKNGKECEPKETWLANNNYRDQVEIMREAEHLR